VKEDIMKSLFLLIALVSVVILGTTAPAVSTSAAAHKQKAVIRFNQPVTLRGITLKGEYLFVHDDDAMDLGEACTYVYKGSAERANNLVASFHCIPIERPKLSYFSVSSTEVSPGVFEVREFQFKGDIEAHAVPPAN
jgi:hypothetical protein